MGAAQFFSGAGSSCWDQAAVAAIRAATAIYTPNLKEKRIGTMDRVFGPLEKLGGRAYELPLLDFLRAHDETASVRMMARYASAARLPYYDARQQFRDLWDPAGQAGWTTPITHVGSPYFLELSGLFRRQALHETVLAQARIALALNRCKRDTGRYPDTLGELKPQYADPIPADPFSGAEMAYVRIATGYLLSSVGENGQADLAILGPGQTGETPSTAEAIPVNTGDDRVWGIRQVWY